VQVLATCEHLVSWHSREKLPLVNLFAGNLFFVGATLTAKESAQELTVVPRKPVCGVLSAVLFSSTRSPGIRGRVCGLVTTCDNLTKLPKQGSSAERCHHGVPAASKARARFRSVADKVSPWKLTRSSSQSGECQPSVGQGGSRGKDLRLLSGAAAVLCAAFWCGSYQVKQHRWASHLRPARLLLVFPGTSSKHTCSGLPVRLTYSSANTAH